MTSGSLYLIPVPISDGAVLTIPEETQKACHQITHFVVERAKTARHFLKAIQHPTPLPDIEIIEIPKHGSLQHKEWTVFIEKGISVGVLSESGCPGIADPGSELVSHAHSIGCKVIPLVGPSSLLLALMASGFSGQMFTFHGYLPNDKDKLHKKVKQLETSANQTGHSHLFIETPYRNQKMLASLTQSLQPQTLLSIHMGLTSPDAMSLTLPIVEWKKKGHECLDLHTPAVFIIGK